MEQFERTRELARLIMDGPRSVMLPSDPAGISSWLEPILRLNHYRSSLDRSQSFAVFAVPNCLERRPDDLYVVRKAEWNIGRDKLPTREPAKNTPSIDCSYVSVVADEVDVLDALVRNVDKAASTFPFPVEGIKPTGPSGLRQLPRNAVVVNEYVALGLSRTSRFTYTELHWDANLDDPSQLDQATMCLYEALNDICDNMAKSGIEVIERYDIDPREVARVL